MRKEKKQKSKKSLIIIAIIFIIISIICACLYFNRKENNNKNKQETIALNDKEKQVLSIICEMKSFYSLNPGGTRVDINDIIINNLFYVQNKNEDIMIIGLDWSMSWDGKSVNQKIGLIPDSDYPNRISNESIKSFYKQPENAANELTNSYEMALKSYVNTDELSEEFTLLEVDKSKIKEIENKANKYLNYEKYMSRWKKIKNEKEQYQYGYHALYRDENGKDISINFFDDGICSTNYSNFNYSQNPSGVMRYTVKYISNSCTYREISQRELEIIDDTIASRTATSGGMTMNVGSSKVSSSPIRIEFDENYKTIKIINGHFNYTGDPAFLTFTEQ